MSLNYSNYTFYQVSIIYSINISNSIFKGLLCTDSSNIVRGFFEGSNFNNNLLVDISPTTMSLNAVSVAPFNTTRYTLNGYVTSQLRPDNYYAPNWRTFNFLSNGGVAVRFKEMSFFSSGSSVLNLNSYKNYAVLSTNTYYNSGVAQPQSGSPARQDVGYTIGWFTFCLETTTNSFNNFGNLYNNFNDGGANNLYIEIKPTVNPFCFNIGTQILTLNTENNKFKEQYVPIEKLNVGTLVKNHRNEYREVELIESERLINKPHKIEETMYVLKKEKNKDLIEDLYITGTHSILVDNIDEYKDLYNIYKNGEIIKIDNKYLLFSAFSKDFEKINEIKEFIVYQFVLKNDNNDSDERLGVYANGILVDLPTKNEFLIHYNYNNNKCDEN